MPRPAEVAALESALTRLHRELMDFQRGAHQREHGVIESPAALLHLLFQDEGWAWLKGVSGPLAELEAMPDGELHGRLGPLLDGLAAALVSDAQGSEFQRRYGAALQRSADVILAHAAVVRAIRAARRHA